MLLSEVPDADKEQILAGCVAYHPKWGWIVFQSFEGKNVILKVVSSGHLVGEPISDVFQLRTPSLGYVNSKKHAAYMFRIPKRIMKGGICANNVDVKVVYTNPLLISKDGLLRWVRSFPPESIHMFNKEYPSYDECVKKIASGDALHIAFDRQFSICANGNAYYCGKDKVGTWDEKGIKFLPEHAYLEIMIGDNCGKALQSSKSAPKTRTVGD